MFTDNSRPEITQETIDSLKTSVDCKIILNCKKNTAVNYTDVDYVFFYTKFNYNECINKSMVVCLNEWVLISNDDVLYNVNWFSEIKNIMKARPDIGSFSPMDPRLHSRYYSHIYNNDNIYEEGYDVTRYVSGWAILVKNEVLYKIGEFDEQFDMYYQDNDYAEMLKLHSVKHALVKTALAFHKGTEEVGQAYSDQKIKKLAEDEHKFRNKWNIWK